MTEKLLSMIAKRYALTELNIGDMAKLKANGMTFTIKAYKAKGLGHVSVMRAKGFFGLMKMDTLIVNPTDVDLPLYSYDRIYAMGNDTLIAELYDTLLGESISKKGKKKQEARFDELATEHFCAYLSSPTQTVSNPKDKQKKACFYVEGLLENGGPSTDVFKKSLGEEKTSKLFREVLFGTC